MPVNTSHLERSRSHTRHAFKSNVTCSLESWHMRRKWLNPASAPAGLLALSCSSLRKFVPDLSHRPARTVPLEGASGPLSAAQSRAILQRLQRGGDRRSLRAPSFGIADLPLRQRTGQVDQVGARAGVSDLAVCPLRARIASGLDQRC